MWRRLIGRDDEGRTLFRDREATGKALALLLTERGVEADLVLAIPRGGLEVAEPVARCFALPLDVLVSRKVGAPDQPELALGSVTRLGAVWNEEVLDARRISAETQARLSRAERDEVERRERAFRGVRAAEPVDGRRVLLVDDGLATGATAAAAVQAGLAAGAAEVVVAVPLAPRETVARLERLGAEVVAVVTPEPFGAVGAFYEDFRAVPHERCIEILRRYTSAPVN